MLLSGVLVHWLPMLHDRFLHPATLLAIVATDVGRDIVRVGLLNDNDNPLLCFLSDGIDDEPLLRSWLANDLVLEAAIDSGRHTANVVRGLAQYQSGHRVHNRGYIDASLHRTRLQPQRQSLPQQVLRATLLQELPHCMSLRDIVLKPTRRRDIPSPSERRVPKHHVREQPQYIE